MQRYKYFLSKTIFSTFVIMKYEIIDTEARAEQAVAYFKSGYNCAQAVYMTFSDLFGMDRQMAARIAAPLGAGMGRLREVCGTVSGMFLIAGLAIPAEDPENTENKVLNYTMVQRLAERFRQENGSIICRELLGLSVRQETPTPEPRTENYYKKRPCAELVRCAARIIAEELKTLE